MRDYPVYFYNGGECIQETREYYGSFYHGETLIKKKIGDEISDIRVCLLSHEPSGQILAEFVFDGYIEDSWTEIASNVASGNIDKYGGKVVEFVIAIRPAQLHRCLKLLIRIMTPWLAGYALEVLSEVEMNFVGRNGMVLPP